MCWCGANQNNSSTDLNVMRVCFIANQWIPVVSTYMYIAISMYMKISSMIQALRQMSRFHKVSNLQPNSSFSCWNVSCGDSFLIFMRLLWPDMNLETTVGFASLKFPVLQEVVFMAAHHPYIAWDRLSVNQNTLGAFPRLINTTMIKFISLVWLHSVNKFICLYLGINSGGHIRYSRRPG